MFDYNTSGHIVLGTIIKPSNRSADYIPKSYAKTTYSKCPCKSGKGTMLIDTTSTIAHNMDNVRLAYKTPKKIVTTYTVENNKKSEYVYNCKYEIIDGNVKMVGYTSTMVESGNIEVIKREDVRHLTKGERRHHNKELKSKGLYITDK